MLFVCFPEQLSRTDIPYYTYSTKYGKIYLKFVKNISWEIEMINYQNIAYRITKGFLSKNSVEFYLYWENKIDNINIDNLSLVDKIFVLMCNHFKIGGVSWDLDHKYNIRINKDDVYSILTKCQCFDIEITIMAKSFLLYQFNGTDSLGEQINYIQEHGSIDLPYTYDIFKKD